MKVKDIQIDGFGVWTGLSVDSMQDGMTLFYGPNEAGKTTLMQFLRAMLYGFTPDRRTRYLPPLHGGTPGGAIRVTGPGGGYEIRRHSQLTDNGVVGQLTVSGQDGLAQGQHRLSSLLGQIDEPIFTNVFAIGIRELQELSTLDDTSAADELYKLSSGLDRVSLVDVMRSLRSGRQDMIGRPIADEENEKSKLATLIVKREKLRDEVDQLTRGGRRWSELATQRRVQLQEIEQLTERMTAWERESRTVEVATAAYDTWQKRAELARSIAQTEKETVLPDEAPGQLVQIDAMIGEKKEKLEEIKKRRRELRDKAEQLPVSKRMFELQGRIEAASEQGTWIEALEEQIARLDEQVEKAKRQLDTDAERLGMDEADRLAIGGGDTSSLPDLSKQTLSALAGPAKQVKEQLFLLKQGRSESQEHKTRSDQLGEKLRETLHRANASNLQQAIRMQTETITALKHRMHLGEHLDKLKRHYRDLEKETIELTTAEALPIDRAMLLGVPFLIGGISLLYGLFNILGVPWFAADPDPNWGMICIFIGILCMTLFYFGRENGRRGSSLDLEDCERQIDALRRQIREVEAERDDVESSLPTSSQSLELRLRETEQLLVELESSLPTYHAHQASLQSYKTARDRATSAASGLKTARRLWSTTLDELGLSDSMSPSSIRKLSGGYETLQLSRRRLDELTAEREQRRRERQAIAKRIEALYLEALEVHEDAAKAQLSRDADDREDSRRDNARRDDSRRDDPKRGRAREKDDDIATRFKPRTGPLEQLNHLHEELSRQQHWIKRRRELKEQDLQLKRQQSSYFRSIERGEQQRRALWAKCGVATPEQFYTMVDTKANLAEMRREFVDLEKQVRSIIGNQVAYEDVSREIEGAKASDLDKRWDSLTTRMTDTQQRVAALRTNQGELSQEMKQLSDDNRLSTVQLELGCVERKIASLARRWQTLAVASVLLEDVCNTFERERQPETLREASSFLRQLTDGKYTRIWTPLGTNQLKIDGAEGKSLPLEVLSRGTREAVFIALRLSLAAAYARRGVMLPLILDDVLVNFDRDRAIYAARTLKTFAELGHQVMMFTCHQHIVDIFHDIEAEVRLMPPQGRPGRANVLLPPEPDQHVEEYDEYEEEVEDEEEVIDTETIEEPVAEEAEEQEVVAVTPAPEPKTKIVYVERPQPKPKPKSKKRPQPLRVIEEIEEYDEPEETYEEIEYIDEPAPRPAPAIGWAWFEREPADGSIDADEAAAEAMRRQWVESEHDEPSQAVRDQQREREESWWNGNRTAVS